MDVYDTNTTSRFANLYLLKAWPGCVLCLRTVIALHRHTPQQRAPSCVPLSIVNRTYQTMYYYSRLHQG